MPEIVRPTLAGRVLPAGSGEWVESVSRVRECRLAYATTSPWPDPQLGRGICLAIFFGLVIEAVNIASAAGCEGARIATKPAGTEPGRYGALADWLETGSTRMCQKGSVRSMTSGGRTTSSTVVDGTPSTRPPARTCASSSSPVSGG